MKLINLIKNNSVYILIFLIWIVGFFFRIYRQSDLLGFYYDQARDAKMAWDIISFKNFPAIGPTTGIEGLFLGPFWFYFITPGYFVSRGDPAVAAYFISFIESLTIPFLFLLLSRYVNYKAGLIASFIWSFSYYLIRSSRWFSNPSPLPFFVMILLFSLSKIFIDKKSKYWLLYSISLGLSLQLEAASAVFFIPITFVLILLHLKTFKLIRLSTIIQSLAAFFILLVPQLAFEFKNNFLVTKVFLGFLTGKVNSDSGTSWSIPTLQFAFKRLTMYYETFFSKLDTNTTWISVLFFILIVLGTIIALRKSSIKIFLQIILIWLFLPLLLLLFFSGNYGTLYDYYLTGYFPAFIILFSLSLYFLFPRIIFWPVILAVSIIFLHVNLPYTYNYISAGVDGLENVTLGNQKQAVDYVCQQNKNLDYNVDVYVPPVIPHTYDYLFDWYSRKNICRHQNTNQISNLYTIYEVDPPHPERLNAWLQRQQSIGKIEEENRFGGIVVQKRIRTKYEN